MIYKSFKQERLRRQREQGPIVRRAIEQQEPTVVISIEEPVVAHPVIVETPVVVEKKSKPKKSK